MSPLLGNDRLLETKWRQDLDNQANLPSSGQKAALAGTDGTPSSGNAYVTNSDSRNTNSRAPTAHSTTHETGGTDAVDGNISVAGLVVNADVLRLTNSRTPAYDSTGVVGQICWDENYIYVCVIADHWHRVALSGGVF